MNDLLKDAESLPESYSISNNNKILRRINIRGNTISYIACVVVSMVNLQNSLITALLLINRINRLIKMGDCDYYLPIELWNLVVNELRFGVREYFDQHVPNSLQCHCQTYCYCNSNVNPYYTSHTYSFLWVNINFPFPEESKFYGLCIMNKYKKIEHVIKETPKCTKKVIYNYKTINVDKYDNLIDKYENGLIKKGRFDPKVTSNSKGWTKTKKKNSKSNYNIRKDKQIANALNILFDEEIDEYNEMLRYLYEIEQDRRWDEYGRGYGYSYEYGYGYY